MAAATGSMKETKEAEAESCARHVTTYSIMSCYILVDYVIVHYVRAKEAEAVIVY